MPQSSSKHDRNTRTEDSLGKKLSGSSSNSLLPDTPTHQIQFSTGLSPQKRAKNLEKMLVEDLDAETEDGSIGHATSAENLEDTIDSSASGIKLGNYLEEPQKEVINDFLKIMQSKEIRSFLKDLCTAETFRSDENQTEDSLGILFALVRDESIIENFLRDLQEIEVTEHQTISSQLHNKIENLFKIASQLEKHLTSETFHSIPSDLKEKVKTQVINFIQVMSTDNFSHQLLLKHTPDKHGGSEYKQNDLRSAITAAVITDVNYALSASQIEEIKKNLTEKKFNFLMKRYGLNEKELNLDGLRMLIIGVLSNLSSSHNQEWIDNDFTKKLFLACSLRKEYEEAEASSTGPLEVQKLREAITSSNDELWKQFANGNQIEYGLDLVSKGLDAAGEYLVSKLFNETLTRFKNNGRLSEDLEIALASHISDWKLDKDPNDPNPVKERQQIFASNEYLFHKLAYIDLQEGAIIPILELNGEQNFYKVRSLIDEYGIHGFVLVPIDHNKSLDLKIVFKGSTTVVGEILDSENYIQLQAFKKHKETILNTLNKIVLEVKDTIPTRKQNDISMNIGGHGSGGTLAQCLINELATYQAAQVYDPQVDGIELLNKHIEEQVEYEEKIRTELKKEKIKDPDQYKDQIKRDTVKHLKKVKNSLDQIENNQLGSIKQFTLTTSNSGGVPTKIRNNFIQSLHILRSKDKQFTVKCNKTIVDGDLVHKTGATDLAAGVSEKLMPTTLLKVDAGFGLLTPTWQVVKNAVIYLFKKPAGVIAGNFGYEIDSSGNWQNIQDNAQQIGSNIIRSYTSYVLNKTDNPPKYSYMSNKTPKDGKDISYAEFAGYHEMNKELSSKIPVITSRYYKLAKKKIYVKIFEGESVKILKGDTALHKAVRKKDLPKINELLLQGEPVNAKNNSGLTALHLAAQYGHLEIVKTLLTGLNIDVNAKNNSGLTALHLAAQYGHLKIVKILLEKMVDFNIQDKHGVTALHLAAQHGHVEVVGVLLEKIKQNNKTDFDDRRAINVKDQEGITALHLAALNGHLGVVDMLLRQGANVKVEDKNSLTPLDLVTHVEEFTDKNKGDYQKISELLTKQLTALPSEEVIPLESIPVMEEESFERSKSQLSVVSAQSSQEQEEVKELHLTEITSITDQKQTPLHIAVENEDEDEVKKLLRKGDNVNSQNSEKQTPLHLAVLKRNSAIVDILLTKSPQLGSIHLQDSNGQSPLHIAIVNGDLDIVKKILAAPGSSIGKHAANRAGKTPLHLAVEHEKTEMVEELLAKSVQVIVNDANGNTPLHIAVQKGNEGIVKLLLKRCTIKEKEAEASAINTSNIIGKTAIYLAVELAVSDPQKMPIFNEFLLKSVDVNAPADDPKPFKQILNIAAENDKSIEIFKSLLKMGAKIDDSTLDAAVKGGATEIVRGFLSGEWQQTSDINSNKLLNLLKLAVENQRTDVAKILLEHIDIAGESWFAKIFSVFSNKDVVKSKDVVKLLHTAAKNGDVNLIDAFLLKGIDLNAKNDSGKTVLHIAVENGDVKTVEALLEKQGIDLNAKDNYGETALHIAATLGKQDVVEKLLEHAARVDIENNNGKIPLELAAVLAPNIDADLYKQDETILIANRYVGIVKQLWDASNGSMQEKVAKKTKGKIYNEEIKRMFAEKLLPQGLKLAVLGTRMINKTEKNVLHGTAVNSLNKNSDSSKKISQIKHK